MSFCSYTQQVLKSNGLRNSTSHNSSRNSAGTNTAPRMHTIFKSFNSKLNSCISNPNIDSEIDEEIDSSQLTLLKKDARPKSINKAFNF
ncbi:hypothetical protein Trydic_g4036 [Trypoxylus dichotomus]